MARFIVATLAALAAVSDAIQTESRTLLRRPDDHEAAALNIDALVPSGELKEVEEKLGKKPDIVLSYFSFDGRGLPAKYALLMNSAEVDVEKHPLTGKTTDGQTYWMHDIAFKAWMPEAAMAGGAFAKRFATFGTLPVMTFPNKEGDRLTLGETFAVSRYAAAHSNLLPSCAHKNAYVEEAMSVSEGVVGPIAVTFFAKDDDEKKEKRTALFDEKTGGVRAKLNALEARMKDRKTYVGDDVTLADVHLACMMRFLKERVHVPQDYVKSLTQLNAVQELVESNPMIQKYLTSRPAPKLSLP